MCIITTGFLEWKQTLTPFACPSGCWRAPPPRLPHKMKRQFQEFFLVIISSWGGHLNTRRLPFFLRNQSGSGSAYSCTKIRIRAQQPNNNAYNCILSSCCLEYCVTFELMSTLTFSALLFLIFLYFFVGLRGARDEWILIFHTWGFLGKCNGNANSKWVARATNRKEGREKLERDPKRLGS